MIEHESSVNFSNLIRDLAESYPFDVSEVVLVELVANSLDAQPTEVFITYDPNKRVLTVSDNGKGMGKDQFNQYHDFAAGLKTRGKGIGFAGVGAKISFNIADKVITETRSEKFSEGSEWYFKPGYRKLVWKETKARTLKNNGTRVEIHFSDNADIRYTTKEDLTTLLRRHYLPLLEMSFLKCYDIMECYSDKLRFFINGAEAKPFHADSEFGLTNIRRFYPEKRGKKFGYALFGVSSEEWPVGPDAPGILLCTRGKVIKGELFNQFPGQFVPKIFGIAEVPPFVKFLTTSKNDFIRKGKFREFEELIRPIREQFRIWLEDIGVEKKDVDDIDDGRKLEKELKKIIDEIPELGEFFGFRTRIKVPMHNGDRGIPVTTHQGIEPTFPNGEGESLRQKGFVDAGTDPGESLTPDDKATQRAEPISRKAKTGPKISFAQAQDRVDLAWVEGNTVVINTGHPSYKKSFSGPARILHNLFAIGAAIQRYLAEQGEIKELTFIDRLMAAWGRK